MQVIVGKGRSKLSGAIGGPLGPLSREANGMRETMHTNAASKYRFEILNGGQCPIRGRRRGRRVKTAAELQFEREVREAFAALIDRHGNRPSEAIQKICEGIQIPLGIFGRRVIEAERAGCTHEQVRALGQCIIDWIDSLFDDSRSYRRVA